MIAAKISFGYKWCSVNWLGSALAEERSNAKDWQQKAITMTEKTKSLLPHGTDQSLLESFRYINSMPGKNVRGKMIDCFELWMRVDSSKVLDSIKVSFGGFTSECSELYDLIIVV